jgi:hypothetical protein
VNIEPLLYWVKEREAIRLRKNEADWQAGWTSDSILATYRFCNVRRRDDKVSVWLRANVLRENYLSYDPALFMMFSAWCRWINWPPTIIKVMGEGFYPAKEINWTKLGQFLNKIEGKTYTGAYMVLAPKKAMRLTKGVFISKKVVYEGLKPITDFLGARTNRTGIIRCPTPTRKVIWELLHDRLFWGEFMSGQIVDDWSWTPLLAGAADHYIWAPQGPGSVRGYNRLLGNQPLTKKPDRDTWCGQLIEWRQAIISNLGPQYEDLTLMDVQNCLCEVDKYLRVKAGEGRPRSKYKPETRF